MFTKTIEKLATLGLLDETALKAQPGLILAISNRGYEPEETIYQHDDECDIRFQTAFAAAMQYRSGQFIRRSHNQIESALTNNSNNSDARL